MQTDAFQWDDDKAAQNVAEHRITFEVATFAFDDRHAFEEDAGLMRYGPVCVSKQAKPGG